MSKFKRKRKNDRSENRNLAKALQIIAQNPQTTQALTSQAEILDISEDLLALIIISTLALMAAYPISDRQP